VFIPCSIHGLPLSSSLMSHPICKCFAVQARSLRPLCFSYGFILHFMHSIKTLLGVMAQLLSINCLLCPWDPPGGSTDNILGNISRILGLHNSDVCHVDAQFDVQAGGGPIEGLTESECLQFCKGAASSSAQYSSVPCNVYNFCATSSCTAAYANGTIANVITTLQSSNESTCKCS